MGHSRWFGPGFMGFGPWSGRTRFFEAGEVRIALLSLLDEGAAHGYELMKELETRSGGMYKASAGTIYPTLQQLEDEGLVTVRAENGKKVYSLTDAGRDLLEEEADTVRRIWNRAERWEEWGSFMSPEGGFVGPEMGEILGPLGGVAKTAMKAVARAGGDRDVVRRVREILERARSEMEEAVREA